MEIRRMALFVVILCTALLDVGLAVDKKKTKKLQIGVKKRVKDCKIRSTKGDTLHMHYTGKLEDGTEFDSSIPRGEPFVFTLGKGQVIKGWDQGLLNMCVGEKRKLVIPSDLAEVVKSSTKMKDAEKAGVSVVSEDYLDAVKKGGAMLMISQHSIVSWGNILH